MLPNIYMLCYTSTSGGTLEGINFYECLYTDVLIKKLFSTLTERNNILLKTQSTDPHF